MDDAEEKQKRLDEANWLVEQARIIYESSVCSFMGCGCCLGSSGICPLKHIKQALEVCSDFSKEYMINYKQSLIDENWRQLAELEEEQ
jgi:hypothetical protein